MAAKRKSTPLALHSRHDVREVVAVFDQLRCGLFVRAADGTIVAVNQRVIDWLGYTEKELLGQDMILLAPPELRDLWESEVETGNYAKDPRPMILAIRRKDGSTMPVLSLSHRVLGADGEFLAAFSIALDLGDVQTARRMGEQPGELRGKLQRIALELQSIAMTSQMPAAVRVPFEHPDLEALSPREKEVLSYLVAGDRVPAISAKLFISPHTVRNHLKSIYSKLYVGSQSQLIEYVRNLEAE